MFKTDEARPAVRCRLRSGRRRSRQRRCVLDRDRDLWFIHLRHTATVPLAEAGATLSEIATLSGQRFKAGDQVLEHYLVRTAPQAASGFQKRRAQENASGSNV